MAQANYETYYKFADELDAFVRSSAEKKEYGTMGETYAHMFGYTLSVIPHLLNQLQLTEEQAQVVVDYLNQPCYQNK